MLGVMKYVTDDKWYISWFILMICWGVTIKVWLPFSMVFAVAALLLAISITTPAAKNLKKLKRQLEILEAIKSCSKEVEEPNGTELCFTLKDLKRELDERKTANNTSS